MVSADQLELETRRKLILALQKAILDTFSESDWKEIGYQTGTEDWIGKHPRLLRSLRWGDDDYRGHVLSAIEVILRRDPSNLAVLLDDQKIRGWLKQYEPGLYSEAAGEPVPVTPFQPSTSVTIAVVERAISDAEILIYSSGATSAVDRIHTALHGYLLAVCDKAGILYGNDPSITELFKLLRQHHPSLQNLGPRSADIVKILRAFSSILDALNPLRNQASVAHPNLNLLEEKEAMLVINAAKTVLHYLNAKLES